MKKAIVVGGGFSGMVTAYFLAKKGYAVDLHEASERLGGMLSSERTPHGLVESAANGFIFTEELAMLFSDLKLDHILPLPEYKKKRFIFRDGLRKWPLRFFETVSLVFKFLPQLIFQRAKLAPKNGETIWNWGLRCLGYAPTKYLLGPGLQGIYAGNPRALSAKLILGPIFAVGRSNARYRGTVSFENGMGEFIQKLSFKLQELGVSVFLNSTYRIVRTDVPHVLCVSAAAAPDLLQGVAANAAAEIARIEMLPVLSATVFYQKAQEKIEGFGCLFPDEQGANISRASGARPLAVRSFKALGVLSNTYIFKNRGPDYSETWIYGGVRSPEVLQMSDGEVLHLIQQERRQMFNSYSEFSECRLHRWPKGLPHYTVELEEMLERLQLPKNIYLNGNYCGSIGLSKILSRTRALTDKIVSEGAK